MPANTIPTAKELRVRAETLLEEVRASTPPWLTELTALADELESRYPPEEVRPHLTLIRGGRDDA